MASAKLWLRAAGLSGATSVGAAAYGAHGMKEKREDLQVAFANGNKLHMIHSAALLAGSGATSSMRLPSVTLGLFSAGIAIFSGSCYAAALSGDRANGRLAPIGGTSLILAWATLLL